jgi:hypothetical protein
MLVYHNGREVRFGRQLVCTKGSPHNKKQEGDSLPSKRFSFIQSTLGTAVYNHCIQGLENSSLKFSPKKEIDESLQGGRLNPAYPSYRVALRASG